MKLKSRVEKLVEELEKTDYFRTHFVTALEKCLSEIGKRKIELIICYGLGSFCDSVNVTSRYQLALLILLHKYLLNKGHPLCKPIEIYDPSFQALDLQTLLNFNSPEFTLIQRNEFCARRIDESPPIDSEACRREQSCVFFYMPHLDKYLYNNLIGVNWNKVSLRKLVVLGNSFQEMIDNERAGVASSELHYLNVLVNDFSTSKINKKEKKKNLTSNTPTRKEKALIETSIQGESFEHTDIFNSLSFHLFSEKWFVNNAKQIELYNIPDWACRTNVPADDWDD